MVNGLKKIRMVRIAFILWSIAVMTAIFLFSAQPGETSDALSGGLLQMLLDWLRISGSAEQVELFHLMLRKLAHFSIYAMLGVGVMGTAMTFQGKGWMKFLLALLICAGYAATDEFHQLFVGARCGSPLDVLLDSCGAACGCGVTMAVWYICNRINHKQ